MNANNPQIDWNDPKVQQAWAFFQQQIQPNQQNQIPQQAQVQQNPNQQNLFQQQQFFLQQQQQQQYMLQQQYMQFCQIYNINPQHPNSQMLFNQYMANQNPNFPNPNPNFPNPNPNFPNPNPFPNPFPNPAPNPNPSTNNSNSHYINSTEDPKEIKPHGYQHTNAQQPKEVIPRIIETREVDEKEITKNFGKTAGMGVNIINITLTATSGLKVVIPAPNNMTFKELFIQYVKKVGIPESVIGTKIVFLFNAEKLDVNSQEPISKSFKHFSADITVLDQGNIIGA